jgi:hypothetical protein
MDDELQEKTWELLLEVASEAERFGLNSDKITPHHTRLLLLIKQDREASEQRGVTWAIGIIDRQHNIEGRTTEADRLFKGVKNNLRDCYKHETGVDPAPTYPVKVRLTTSTETEA